MSFTKHKSKQSKSSNNSTEKCQVLWKVFSRRNLAYDKKYSLNKFSNNYKPISQCPTQVPVLVKTYHTNDQAVEYIKKHGLYENIYLLQVWRNGQRVDGTISQFFPCSCCDFTRQFKTTHSQKWAYNPTQGWHKSNYVHNSEFISSNVNFV